MRRDAHSLESETQALSTSPMSTPAVLDRGEAAWWKFERERHDVVRCSAPAHYQLPARKEELSRFGDEAFLPVESIFVSETSGGNEMG